MSTGLQEKGGKPDPGHPNQITVKVRYGSDIVDVKINVNASIEALLSQAIKETGNENIPKERFQLKLDGVVLDTKKKVNDYPIKEGTLLILTLIAGGGGSSAIF